MPSDVRASVDRRTYTHAAHVGLNSPTVNLGVPSRSHLTLRGMELKHLSLSLSFELAVARPCVDR